jgi:hypothetical protein
VIAGTANEPEYVVIAAADARLGLVGTSVGRNYDLDIMKVDRPYRALWRSAGLDPDGWIVGGRTASIRVFSQPGRDTEIVNVEVQLIDVAGKQRVVHLHPCVPQGRFGDAKLPTFEPVAVGPLPSNPPEGGERLASRRVGAVAAFPTGKPC